MTDAETPAAIRRFVDAVNSADTDAFVDVFSEDGFVDDWGRVLRGPAGVRSWADSDAIGAGARMTLLSASVDGSTVRIHFDWRSRVDADAYPHGRVPLMPQRRTPGLACIALHSHRGHRVISGRSRAAMRAAQRPKPSRTACMTAIPASPAPRQLHTAIGAQKRGKAA